jgi:hypothetical protein
MVVRLAGFVGGSIAMVAVAALSAQPRLTKQDADRFHEKLTRIIEYGEAAPLRGAQPRSTALTDAEINSYFKFLAGDQIPVGIVEPTVSAVGEGRVSGRAMVDLDAVRKGKDRGMLDPMNLLTGRLPITATGRLTTKGGIGQFTLESVDISGVNVPKSVLQELLTYYSRTKEKPSGINMDDPFELPARIKEIRVGSGAATVIQ